MFFNLRLIDRIRAGPAEMLGDHSISRLAAFLVGHSCACFEPAAEVIWFPIYDHLRKKYGIRETTHGYYSLLLLISGSEAAGLDRFLQELDEYLTFYRDHASDPARWPQHLAVKEGDIDRKMSLSDTLASADRSPIMLLGCASITRMHAFLLGLVEGHQDAGRDIGDLTKLDAFESWLNAQEQLGTHCRWDRILLYRSGEQEGDAVTMFLKEFRSFERHV